MILLHAKQWIWVLENMKTGKLLSWSAASEESLVKESLKCIGTWGLDLKDYQIAAFSLDRELGREPDETPSINGNFYIDPNGKHTSV